MKSNPTVPTGEMKQWRDRIIQKGCRNTSQGTLHNLPVLNGYRNGKFQTTCKGMRLEGQLQWHRLQITMFLAVSWVRVNCCQIPSTENY